MRGEEERERRWPVAHKDVRIETTVWKIGPIELNRRFCRGEQIGKEGIREQGWAFICLVSYSGVIVESFKNLPLAGRRHQPEGGVLCHLERSLSSDREEATRSCRSSTLTSWFVSLVSKAEQ